MIKISLTLSGIVYGVLVIAEHQFLRKMKAIENPDDDKEDLDRKSHKNGMGSTILAE